MNPEAAELPQPLDDWATLPGRLVVISGPSGSGKSTLARRVLDVPGVSAELSVSATSRSPRPGETDGRDYFFYSRDRFEREIAQGAFLEWAEVHGNLYGTPAAPVREALAAGRCVILEIDVQGGFQVLAHTPSTYLIFVRAPTFAVLEERLRARRSEDEATLQRRLETARHELSLADRYHHQLINDSLDHTVAALADLLIQLSQRGTQHDV